MRPIPAGGARGPGTLARPVPPQHNGSAMTLLYTHPSGVLHATPPGHPEQVARLDAVLGALDGLTDPPRCARRG